MKVNEITGAIIDCAMRVHSVLGPGLLEGVYKACLAYELKRRGLRVQLEIPLPVRYEEVVFDLAYRMDMVVEDAVVVELKAIEKLLPIHKAQVISYLKLSGKHIALLINFNVLHLRDGVQRIVHGLEESTSSATSASSAV